RPSSMRSPQERLSGSSRTIWVPDMAGAGDGEGEALGGLLTAFRRSRYLSRGRPKSVSNDTYGELNLVRLQDCRRVSRLHALT
ncbi:MAG: hypothetical protein AB1700_17995, partial [Bacillota bacterium]